MNAPERQVSGGIGRTPAFVREILRVADVGPADITTEEFNGY